MRPSGATLDCMRCGACCANSSENRAEGYRDYVEVGPRDPIAGHPELVRRFVVSNARGEQHLKLAADQRCAALRGRLGRQVRCEIYRVRPAGCRRVQPGSSACARARVDAGIDRSD